MNTKHTKGPWRIRPGYGLLLDSIEGDDGNRAVAIVWTRQSGPRGAESFAEGEANARLIVAAQDLMEALKECAKLLAYGGFTFDEREEAVALADAALAQVGETWKPA